MATPNLANIQGDLISHGFPKSHETYYFFSIAPGKEKDFTKALAALGQSGQISSLEKVRGDWCRIEHRRCGETIPLSNALIAFSKTGLDAIQAGLPDPNRLNLDAVEESDPAFAAGMAQDGPDHLFDPPAADWDPLFNTTPIHGILKIAAESQESVDSKMDEIKRVLGYPNVIADIPASSLPTTQNSRLDGQVRPKEEGLKGHEHFGFRDGVSQPLLEGVDTLRAFQRGKSMQTPQNVITVTDKPPLKQEGSLARPESRPQWMVDGSFLVFRKLEQDVQGFLDLTAKWESAGCYNSEQFGAKLMGRWKNGAPVSEFPDKQPDIDPIKSNEFKFDLDDHSICPLAAHIRKTNPRDGESSTVRSRMIRNGTPYGTEFSTDKTGKRGLLFACYQSSIENGFRFVQKFWSNNIAFPQHEVDAGHDPFIGQAEHDGKLRTTMFVSSEKGGKKEVNELTPGFGEYSRLVTMKGGEYFFVPSISALSQVLGSA